MKGKDGDKPTQADLDFMKKEGPVRQFCDQEAPLMLLMNPHSDYAESKHKLPAFLYQTGELKDFRLASLDVEQIAVKQVHQTVEPNSSGCAQGLQGDRNAIDILH